MMPDITLYKPSSITVNVIDGDPPVDQTALVAQLQQQVSTLTAEVSSLQSKIANANTIAAQLAAGVASLQAALA